MPRKARAKLSGTVVWMVAGLSCGALTQCDTASRARVEPPLLHERFVSGRLADQNQWKPCAVADSTALVLRMRCGTPLSADNTGAKDLIAFARDAATRGRSDSSAKALRLAATIDLRGQLPAGIDRAIEALETAARRFPDDALVRNDLAVAYLAGAERDQQLRPLLHALEAIEIARGLTDTLTPVLFNRALILQRLHLVESARQAWKHYYGVERSTDWRDEAGTHLRSLDSLVTSGLAATPTPEALLAPDSQRLRSQLAALARHTPQWARESGFGLLGAWGTAVLNADSARATLALSLAAITARAVDDVRGDRSLALAVEYIEARRASAAQVPVLARAHAEYADGFALYSRGAYDEAATVLGRSEQGFRSLGSPTARWAALYRAVALINLGSYDAGDRILRDVAAAATPAEPALEGKADWVLGLSQVRRGAYEVANRRYREAVPFFVRAGEKENVGMLASLLAEGLELAGQTAAGQVESLRALSLLAPYRRSPFLANHLGSIAYQARAEGLHRAALSAMSEVSAGITGLDRAHIAAWAAGERARDFIAVGNSDSARAEVDEALRSIERMDADAGRDQFRTEIAIAQARLARATDPHAARDQLLGVVAAYRARNYEFALPNALYQAALAARDAGDTLTARRCLEEAVGRIETRRALFPTPEVRASFYETMEGVFDELITLELTAGRPDAAFRYLERARAAAWADRPEGVPPLGIAEAQRHLPANTVLLEYAVLPDRAVAWVIMQRAWRHEEIPISRDSVAALGARFNAESGMPVVPGGGARAQLYDLFLARAAPELEASAAVAVVPDRELSRVPFAALWNRKTEQYLVDRLSVRTLPSAAFVAASAGLDRRNVRPEVMRALVVGDPAFDRVAVPQVGRLPGAAREAARVADLYAEHKLLTDTEAGRSTTVALLQQYSIFHFAGHAIANLEQPELSYLAFAADGPGSDGILRAREIATLRLSNLTMVVLSACSTLGTRATHVGALAGLAYSFLRARVPATVSTLWDVDDEVTTPLLVAFHRYLAAGAPAADALRSAQREALQSQQGALRAPRAWAAFVYTGP